MRIRYLESDYVSHAVAARGHRAALARAGAIWVDRVEDAEVVILHDEPAAYAEAFDALPALKEKYVVAYAVWETDVVPQAYRDGLSLVQEVWTASRSSQHALRQAHERVFVVPHVVEAKEPAPAAVAAMSARLGPKTGPRFFCISDARNPRKNLPALLRAFEQVHAAHPSAQLVVKQYARIDETLNTHAGVIAIHDGLHADEMTALHRLCDAYVSPHRGEAWGLGLSEAMAQGRLVIATAHGGPADYLNDDVAVPLPFTLRALSDEEAAAGALWTSQMQWAEVDASALAAAMMRVAEGHVDPRAAAGRRHILAGFGLEAATTVAEERLTELRRQVPESRGQVTPATDAKGPRVGLWHRVEAPGSVIVGRQVVVDDFLRGLARYGHMHRYGLFCPEGTAGPLAARLEAPTANIDVHRRTDARAPSMVFSAWHDPQFDPALALALRAQRGGRYPITTTHHSLSYVDLLHGRLLPLLLHRPRPYDAIICTTGPARRVVARLLGHAAETLKEAHGLDVGYRGQLVTIPLGVDTERFRPRPQAVARRRFGIDADAEVLLWVGRLSVVDKADLLPMVDALAELAHRRPKVRLVCAGRQRPGERFGDLLRSYAERIGVADRLDVRTDVGEELPLLYAAADLFVAPVDNVQESFGLSPVEAMACGLPQVVADWDGYRDTVTDDTGVRIPTLWTDAQADIELGSLLSDPAYDHLALAQSVAVDMRAFVQAVDGLLDNPERRAAMSDASRLRAEMLFGWPSVIAAHDLLWNQLGELANKDDAETTDLSGLHRFPYARAFRHYPTTWLPRDAPLTLTDKARALMQQGDGLPLPWLDRFSYLDVSVLQRILVGLAKMAAKEQSLSLDRIFTVVGKGLEDTPENRSRLNRHVMWLIKYGYCQRVS